MQLDIYQKKAVEANENKILCLAAAGSGKAILNSTIIPTPNGPRRVSDIRIGDFLFDKYGKPTKVLGVFPQGKLDVYEITFGDGRKALCSEDHLWAVNARTWRNRLQFKTYTVKQLLELGYFKIDNRGHKTSIWHIPCSSAVQYETKEYDIDPYVIGCFLGDGCCSSEDNLTISSKDEELVAEVSKLIKAEKYIKRSDFNYSWSFECIPYINNYNQNVKYFKTNIFFKEFKDELIQLSYNKKIPDIYKYGSIEQRYSLIQGLMDTDGNITRNGGRYNVRFDSVSYQLILDIKEVLGSLGYVSTIIEDTREKYTNGKCYQLLINISNSEKYKLFRLKRKKNIALECKDKKQNHHYDTTTILSIKKLNYQEEMTCFLVDNEEHLFLMNDFIVTHNTRALTERIRYLIENKHQDPMQIVAITFTNTAADEMKKRLEDVRQGTFIGTLHSYANFICLKNGIDTTRYIEMKEFDKIIEKAILISRNKYPQIDHLLIDEAQDLGELDYQFIEKIPTKNIFFVADDRQAIYQFRGCSDKYIRNMALDDNYKKYYLNFNYRCAPNIQNFANSLLWSYTALSPCPDTYKKRNGILERNMTIDDALSELEWSKNWGSWFILTRTNEELGQIQDMLDKKEIPNVTFKKGDLDIEELANLLETNKVKVLTIHSAKGLENKNVIVVGARMYNYDERRIAYVAATRAENALYWCTFMRHKKKGTRRDSTCAGDIFSKTEVETIKF